MTPRLGTLKLGIDERQVFTDEMLQLKGNTSLIGRSVVIFDTREGDGKEIRLACANIEKEEQAKTTISLLHTGVFDRYGTTETYHHFCKERSFIRWFRGVGDKRFSDENRNIISQNKDQQIRLKLQEQFFFDNTTVPTIINQGYHLLVKTVFFVHWIRCEISHWITLLFLSKAESSCTRYSLAAKSRF